MPSFTVFVNKRLFALIVALLFYTNAHAQVTGSGTATVTIPTDITTTTALYAEATVSWPACGMWHPSGICFFLFCTPFGCSIKNSNRYSHMRPDLVVSTYHDLDNHPWPQVGLPIGKMALKTASLLYKAMIGDSAGTRSRPKRTDKNTRFRDGDAIGHPGGSFIAPGDICPTGVTAFKPYYSSFTDGMIWRNFLPADMLMPATWVPGLREVGTWPLNTWGGVFPRTGWLTNQHEVKVGAVLSQRIADIITRTGEARIYTDVPTGGMKDRDGETVFDPPPAMENNPLGGTWQLSAPFRGVTACTPFGLNDSVSPASYGDAQTSTTGSYAFSLWRPYACCRTKGVFLYAIVWGLW
jgi:integrating conjugative element protein (TIGR03756 family)